MQMENCDVKFGDARRTLSTRNVTAKAIITLFGLHPTASIWLKDMTDTYVFPDENGLFPVLDPFTTYHVEVGPSRDQESHTGKCVKCLNNYLSLSEESSDDDLQRSAYRLSVASAGKSASKKKLKDQKGRRHGGKQPVPSTAASVTCTDSAAAWFFKVTVGQWKDKKIIPVRNVLIRCGDGTDCEDIRRKLPCELQVSPLEIQLFDSDYLVVDESPGRIGKYWSGTRKIFAIVTPPFDNDLAQQQQNRQTVCNFTAGIKDAVNPLMQKMVAMDEKLSKAHAFMLKGPESVYKDIAVFAKDMFKCPICLAAPKDEIPYAVSCCNHIFCMPCISELVKRGEIMCALCKQRRGPPYPVLLSGARELVEKIAAIPSISEDNE